MADILDLAQARDALGWKEGQNPDRDELLNAQYIPATTRVIEAWCGRMEDRVETWVTDGAASITTPWTSGTVREVRSVRTPYARSAALSGYTYTLGGLTFANAPSGRVEVTVGNLPTPPDVILAAGIILAHLWNADHQGMSQQSVIRSEGQVQMSPRGFAIPRRAAALLAPYAVAGFA